MLRVRLPSSAPYFDARRQLLTRVERDGHHSRYADVVQSGRTRRCQRRGHGFESHRPHQSSRVPTARPNGLQLIQSKLTRSPRSRQVANSCCHRSAYRRALHRMLQSQSAAWCRFPAPPGRHEHREGDPPENGSVLQIHAADAAESCAYAGLKRRARNASLHQHQLQAEEIGVAGHLAHEMTMCRGPRPSDHTEPESEIRQRRRRRPNLRRTFPCHRRWLSTVYRREPV